MGPGKLFDISRYVNFFKDSSAMGGDGVRVDPADVILAAIAAPPTPVESVLGNPGNPDPSQPGGYAACPAGTMVGTQNCSVLLGHSCNASPLFFGDPAVRIHGVLNAVNPQSSESSICAMDDTTALTNLGMSIGAKIH
jgi:hypothetical protein